MSPRGAQPAASPAAEVALLVAIGLTLGLYLIPAPWGSRLAWPLLMLSTCAHEMCHGLAALVVGGQFESFRLWPDGSGIASTADSGKPIENAFIAAGGLLGPAVFAAGMFVAASRPRLARYGLGAFGLALLASELLVVRGGFGLVYVGAAGALLLALAVRLSPAWARIVVLFMGAQLSLAVFSRADYLFTKVARTAGGDEPSDVEVIAQALGLPYYFWGLVCGGLSLAVLAAGAWVFRRATRER